MAELLKNIYNEAFLRQFGERIYSAYQDFPVNRFVEEVMQLFRSVNKAPLSWASQNCAVSKRSGDGGYKTEAAFKVNSIPYYISLKVNI